MTSPFSPCSQTSLRMERTILTIACFGRCACRRVRADGVDQRRRGCGAEPRHGGAHGDVRVPASVRVAVAPHEALRRRRRAGVLRGGRGPHRLHRRQHARAPAGVRVAASAHTKRERLSGSPRSREISTKVGVDSALRNECKAGLTTPNHVKWVDALLSVCQWCLSTPLTERDLAS